MTTHVRGHGVTSFFNTKIKVNKKYIYEAVIVHVVKVYALSKLGETGKELGRPRRSPRPPLFRLIYKSRAEIP